MFVLATFSAVPVVVAIVLTVPVTLTVPPPVATKPLPLVASMSSPPPVKLMVAPVLLVRLTAVDVPPFSTLLAPENVIVPAALPSRKITLAFAAGVRDSAGQCDVAGARSAILDVDRARGTRGRDRPAVGDRRGPAGTGTTRAVADEERRAGRAGQGPAAQRNRAAGGVRELDVAEAAG